MDVHSPKQRSYNMSQIKGRDTKPELLVRSLLHRLGYRFRLYRKDLSGNPDIVLSKYRTIIFVHGCFWHQHKGCKNSTIPKTHRYKWLEKLDGNVKRDERNMKILKKHSWKVLTVWECELTKKPAALKRKLERIKLTK